MTELWRLAAADQTGAREGAAEDDSATRMLRAERDARDAQADALKTLNQDLQRHRATAEKSLAEARALLTRREAALGDERARSASLDQALAQARLELEVALERHKLALARVPRPSGQSVCQKRKSRKAALSASARRAKAAKRPASKKSSAGHGRNAARTHQTSRNQKRK